MRRDRHSEGVGRDVGPGRMRRWGSVLPDPVRGAEFGAVFGVQRSGFRDAQGMGCNLRQAGLRIAGLRLLVHRKGLAGTGHDGHLQRGADPRGMGHRGAEGGMLFLRRPAHHPVHAVIPDRAA
ncbi:hypothetical protein XACLG98_1520004 [Xanthomonas citri pv. citri]|nr:hypothetical protein XAC3608_920010 [Xanthomonas citri pv. citri]CEI06417.1 hypothetical protein XACLG98_1520004 [Xanthomonas citri pv. citri]CEJ23726.1 hypothetical protein XACE116_5880007 [Xanthomonas citri pv. citri]CEJ29388.1 hypothetical protein XACE116_5880007 [Xanthomonas citri pv. citri]